MTSIVVCLDSLELPVGLRESRHVFVAVNLCGQGLDFTEDRAG